MCNEKFHQAYNVSYSRECIWPLYLWWSPFTLATAVGGKKTHRSVKNMNFYRCMTVVISLITSLKSDLCTALTIHNTTDNNCILSHAQNTTAVQPNIYFYRQYVGCSSKTRDGQLSPKQTNFKVNCKLRSQYLYCSSQKHYCDHVNENKMGKGAFGGSK